jgi:predicted Zn finger-like uncharacterized protein
MYTFCPSCSTVFGIKAEHLLAASGRVRCGECGHVFRAFDYVYEDYETVQSALAEHLDQQAVLEEEAPQTGADYADGDVEEYNDQDILDDAIATGFPIPPEYSASWSDRISLGRNIAYGAMIGVLLLLLGVQWLYFNRTALAAQSDWRPGLEKLCSVLRCELPLQVDLSRIELLNRDVRKHPQVEGALLINATLVNRADFPQPYPVLEVTFSNSSGKPVAARRFNPAEYLGGKTDIKAGMPENMPFQVVLEIEDPGEDAVSFQFEFL